jgi:hypothetical protein
MALRQVVDEFIIYIDSESGEEAGEREARGRDRLASWPFAVYPMLYVNLYRSNLI